MVMTAVMLLLASLFRVATPLTLVVVRSTDSAGGVEHFDEKRNQYSGKTGLHRITVRVAV